MVKFSVLSEPRAFIRIAQIIFALTATLTVALYDSSATIVVKCPRNILECSDTIHLLYPFHYNRNVGLCAIHKDCGPSEPQISHYPLAFDHTMSAQFFVFASEVSFAYALITLFVYILGYAPYHSKPLLPFMDFICTLVIAITWLIALLAWFIQFTRMKTLLDNLPKAVCDEIGRSAECVYTEQLSYSSLIIGVISGVISLSLWSSSVWLVYKETRFAKKPDVVPDFEQETTNRRIVPPPDRLESAS